MLSISLQLYKEHLEAFKLPFEAVLIQYIL